MGVFVGVGEGASPVGVFVGVSEGASPVGVFVGVGERMAVTVGAIGDDVDVTRLDADWIVDNCVAVGI